MNVQKSEQLQATEHVMRINYRPLTQEEQKQLEDVKNRGAEFLYVVDRLNPSRETSLAKTKIEEAVMWAVKSITR